MIKEIKTPKFQESISEGTVASWHRKVGEQVSRDTPLVEIETDKVMLEVVAPAAGCLVEILRQDGEVVQGGDLLARFETVPDSEVRQTEDAGAATALKKSSGAPPEDLPPAEMPAPAPAAASEFAMGASVRRLVAKHGLDPARIPATGRGGRLIKADVLAYIKKAAPDAAETAPAGGDERGEERPEKRVPMSRLQARIAERMLATAQRTAMLTTFSEVDMRRVVEMRRQCQEAFQEVHGIKLGIMSFFVQAAVAALRQFPVLNASLEGDEIIYHGYFDIGVAVATERGLVVPVLRDADALDLAGTERAIADFAGRAREGKLRLEEIQGGTFTISNGGVFGSMMSTPILNPPQSGILGIHAIRERPVAVDGRVKIRPMMYLALSYDHRLVDGRNAVQFLAAIRDFIEEPARLLLKLGGRDNGGL